MAVAAHVVTSERARNIFASREWIDLWWRHHGRGGEPPVVETAKGSLPVYVWRTWPLRIARFMGHGAGDELGPACEPGDEDAVAELLQQWLAEQKVDVLLGEQLPREREWRVRLDARPLRTEGSPRLALEHDDWDAYLATRSRNFRSLVRRAERKTSALPAVTYRLAVASTLDGDLDTLFALHRLRWQGARTTFLAHEAFHRAFAAEASRRGWLRLWVLEAEEKPVAAWYGFRFAGAELYYQAGRDPAYDHASAGLALLAHTIRSAMTDGVPEYRFLRGGEEYKYRFTDDDPGLETVAVVRSRRGALALHAADAAARIRSRRTFG